MRFTEKLGLFTILLFIISLPSTPAHSDVKSTTITPSNPKQGDMLTLTMQASPNENLSIAIQYSMYIEVVDGSFVWTADGVEIPQKPNMFNIKAEGVQRLRASVNIQGIPITESSMAVNGVATINQSNVKKGRYWTEISGIALENTDYVKITITAKTNIQTNSLGEYIVYYNSSYMPSGEFHVQVDDTKLYVLLQAAERTENKAPIVVQSHPDTGLINESITFSGQESFDTDGTIVEYLWNFGDEKTGKGTEIIHKYIATGQYTVELTVTDNMGATTTQKSAIQILSSNLNLLTLPEKVPESHKINEEVNLAYSIINRGGVQVNSVFYELEIDGITIIADTVDSISIDESITINIYWTPLNTGIYQIEFKVDPMNQIFEINEQDNNYTSTLQVQGSSQKIVRLTLLASLIFGGLYLIRSRLKARTTRM